MGDDDYARRLLAILTADDPQRPAEDRIDRSSGFGRDHWLESVEVLSGEHGAEVLIEFALRVPPRTEVARSSVTRLAAGPH